MSIFDRLKRQPKAAASTSKTAAPAKDAKAKAPAKGAQADKPAAPKASKKAAASVKPMKQAKQVLIRPLVTEKAALTSTYVFAVPRGVNKTEISKAIEAQYGVKPLHVRTMNLFGKEIRWNYREGKRQDWKKAIVRLPKGQTINVYEAE